MRENNTFSKLSRLFLQLIDGFEDWGTIVALLIMIGLVNLAILLRITINYESSAWEEIARFSHVWFSMLAIAVASKEDSHLRAGIIDNLIKSTKMKKALSEVLINLFALTCITIFAYWSVMQLRWVIRVKPVSLVLLIDMWIIYLSFVVGGILAAIHNLTYLMKAAKAAIDEFKNPREVNPKL